jgi:hypothetical protein
MSNAPLFTVCCLFYGAYPILAERLLESLRIQRTLRSSPEFLLRIGLNDACWFTRRTVMNMVPQLAPVQVYVGKPPYHKYPMMRRMFHGDADASHGFENHADQLRTKYTMWFDDDSWIVSDLEWRSTLCEQVDACMEHPQNPKDLVGAPYVMRLRGNQHLYIREQPWYTGVPVEKNEKVNFITGGWLTIRTEILLRHDWPPPDFDHNGGDVMLGMLCKQQGYRMGKFTTGLAINANVSGRCSTMPRRGCSQQPVGHDYVPGKKDDTPQQLDIFDIMDGKI